MTQDDILLMTVGNLIEQLRIKYGSPGAENIMQEVEDYRQYAIASKIPPAEIANTIITWLASSLAIVHTPNLSLMLPASLLDRLRKLDSAITRT
jgi:hypothetical protein